MDWLQFIAALVSALAWPVTLLALALLLRRPIIELIPGLRKLKFKEFEAEFREKVADSKPPIAQGVQFINEKIEEEKISFLKPISYYRDLAQVSPRAALMEVWMEVETAASEVYYRHFQGARVSATPSQMFNFFLSKDWISKADFQRAKNLQELRNKAAHQIDISEIGPDLIDAYINAAFEIARNLRIKLL
jgi:hypothetical protein